MTLFGGGGLYRIAKAGVLYFIFTFGSGFVLGTVRTLWVAPYLRPRMSELIETPIMLAVIIASARWVIRSMRVPRTVADRLGMGLIGLGLLLTAEFTFVSWVRGITIRSYITNRDPLTGTVYEAMLVVLALTPLLVRRS